MMGHWLTLSPEVAWYRYVRCQYVRRCSGRILVQQVGRVWELVVTDDGDVWLGIVERESFVGKRVLEQLIMEN